MLSTTALEKSRAVRRDRGGQDRVLSSTIPWWLWCCVGAVLCISVGINWDVSWHRSIGRDGFWTPAHMAIYSGALLGAIASAYLILHTTFNSESIIRSRSIAVLGLKGPLGAFVVAWGGVAMLTGGPLDNWWHSAYGLDVTLLSIPHLLICLGMRVLELGAMILVLSFMNGVRDVSVYTHRKLRAILFLLGGLQVSDQLLFLVEFWAPGLQHTAQAYCAVGATVLVMFALISQVSGGRWAASIIAMIYMGYGILQTLIVPLFPAEPKLGPVYSPLSHMVPMFFPMLLIVPGLCFDILRHYTKGWKAWQVAPVAGLSTILCFWAVEWPFSSLLMTPYARNRFFGMNYDAYYMRPVARTHFYYVEHGSHLFIGLIVAIGLASLGTLVGLLLGEWMQRVER